MMAHVLAKDLRDAVLQAALQGKLSKTLSSDTLVCQTIKNFSLEKNELLLNKKMKDRNKFNNIGGDEYLFDIPETWMWVRINDIGIFKKGPFGSALTKSIFVKKGLNTVKVYEQKNAIQKDDSLGNYYITEEYYNSKMTGFKVEPGDIIVSCAGTIGEVYIIPENAEHGIINQALMRMNIVNSVNLDYFMLFFDHILKEEARNNSGGTAIKNIPPFDIFKAMLIPLPPIEEQARIVAKVDELMAKIDEYEKLENELVELKKNFPGDMKAAVLQAAMEGKLTEQLNKDTNPYDLLNSIKIEKEKLITKKIISKEIVYSEFDEPYDIPNNWIWTNVGKVCLYSFSGKSPKYVKNNNGNYTLGQAANQNEGINFAVSKFSTDEHIKSCKEYHFLMENDTLLNTLGGGSVGRVGIFKNPNKYKCVTDGHIFVFRTNGYVNEKYFYYYMKFNQGIFEKMSEGSTNQSFLKLNSIKNYPFPLPPVEEQQRIVEKLDKLLPLCENLCENYL